MRYLIERGLDDTNDTNTSIKDTYEHNDTINALIDRHIWVRMFPRVQPRESMPSPLAHCQIHLIQSQLVSISLTSRVPDKVVQAANKVTPWPRAIALHCSSID